MSKIKINGIELYYEDLGEGTPLVLIAGLGSDSQSWQPVANELSKTYRVIIFDNRGVGRTKPQDIEITIESITDDCIALIKHLKLSSVNILGHSMGGFIALDLAIRYPEYVSKLILVATSAFSSERNNILFSDSSSYLESGMNLELWFRNIFFWIFTKSFFDDKRMLENAVHFAIEYPYQQEKIAFKNQVLAIKKFNCSADLSNINTKTMVICGNEDLLFTPDESKQVLNVIPDALFTTIEHTAHSIHMEKPAEFINIVQKFIDNVLT